MTIKINQFSNKIDRPGDTPLYQIESDGAISIVADGYISLVPSTGQAVHINSDSNEATVFSGIRIGDTTEENNGTIRYHDDDFEGYKSGSWMSFTSGGGGGAPPDAYYWVGKSNTTLTSEINLGSLSNGLLKVSVSSGLATPSIASSGVDYEPAQTKGNITSGTTSAILIANGTNSTVGPSVSISINKASVSQDGYLGKDNWSTFNSKENVLTFQNSITRSVNTINLVNDSSSPGDTKYYGTNGSGTKGWYSLTSGSGDVVGPGSSTNEGISRFDGTTGKLIQNSSVIIGDDGYISIPSGQHYKINGVNLSAPDVGAEPTLSKTNLTESTSSILTITNGTGTVLASSGTTIQVKKATASQDGYLAKGDWSTFSGKESALTFQYSVTRSVNTINLINDSASPGNTKYYGTNDSGTKGWYTLTSGSGDVVGPGSAINEAIVRFDTTTGKLIQSSSVIIGDDGYVSIPSGQHYKINGVNLSASDVGAETTLAKTNLTESSSSILTISNGSNSVIGSSPVTIQVKKASSSQDGYLAKGDWSTFNNKEPAQTKGSISETTSGILTITNGNSSTVGPNVTVQVKKASSSQDGYLAKGDWSTFNSKEPAQTKGSISETTSNILTVTNGSSSTVGPNVTIQVKKATSSQDGYLAKGDW